MFHSEDGLYFRREDNGSVTIIKTNDGKEPFAGEDNIEFFQTIGDGSWCSAVCNVSAAGEENLRWYKAMDFHNEAEAGEAEAGDLPRQHSGIFPDNRNLAGRLPPVLLSEG